MAGPEATTRPLATEEVAGLLRATNESVRSEFSALPEAVASWHPAPGEWCVKECLGHMIEADARGFAGRIRRILEQPGLHDQSWDQVQVQRDRNDDARPLAELLNAFTAMRTENVKLVEGLLNTDLVKTCIHPQVGEISIEELLHEWVHHDRNHFRQALANVQAYAWPAMGNTQKFSLPH